MLKTVRNPSFRRIYFVPLLSNLTGSMTWAINVVYALELGASITEVNLITTIWTSMSVLVLVPFGILSDRMGRKPMLLIPTALTIVGSTIRSLATSPSQLLVAAFIGALSSDFFTILISMVVDVARPNEQREAISTLLLFSSIGMVAGPLIGSILLSFPGIVTRNIYQIDAVAQTCVLAYSFIMIRETKAKTKEKEVFHASNVLDLLRKPSFRYLLVMVFLFFYFFGTMNTYIPIHANRNLSLSDAEVSTLATFRGLATMLIRFSAATFLSRVQPRKLLILAFTLGGIAALVSPLASSYPLLILISFAYGSSFGMTMVLGYTMVSEESTPSNRGTANAVYSVFQSMGSLAVASTSSLAEAAGIAPVFLLAGSASLASTIPISLRRTRQAKGRSDDPDQSSASGEKNRP
jgi:DHA1 family bicyclomycin/chloramphenicol resistance-like MFS transporter